MNLTPSYRKSRLQRLALLWFVCISLLFAVAAPAAAQKNKDKRKNKAAPADSSSTTAPKLPDEQAIDLAISEMLAAWQIGDTDRLHQYYADDASVVSGIWGPPVVGWADFLASYKRLSARMQGVRKDRQNTLVRARGNYAWACFQWDFSATVDGQPMAAEGQTTLIFEKRNDRWLIVHDHTSVVQMAPAARPASTPPGAAPPQ